MYKIEKDNNVVFITNKTRKLKIVNFKEPYQIKIIDVTYGDRIDGGYWSSILNYTNEFMAVVTIAGLKESNKNI